MKTVKYKKEGVIYLMRTITDDTYLELREDERIYMKFGECIKFFDKIDINKKMNLSRTKLDEDKKLEVVILNDKEFDKFKLINTQQGGDNEHFDEKEDYLKYLKYKIKYLELKYGFE